jgi:hypothetical protein
MGKMVASWALVLLICGLPAMNVFHNSQVHGFQFRLRCQILRPQTETKSEISANKRVNAAQRELTSNLKQNKVVSGPLQSCAQDGNRLRNRGQSPFFAILSRICRDSPGEKT